MRYDGDERRVKRIEGVQWKMIEGGTKKRDGTKIRWNVRSDG